MTGDRPEVVLALTPVAERAVEHLLFGEQPPVVPVASVGEADELEVTARDEHAVAVLISPQLSGLSTGHCERVRATGLMLVGVALDEHDEQDLQALAVDVVIDPSTGPAGLLKAIQGTTNAAATPAPASPSSRRPAATSKTGAGTAVAVVGSRGTAGASECAASLASIAAGRWPTVLVELDALGGGLAVRLGADPHQGSVLGLIRAANAGEELVPELLERWVTSRQGWPPVLLGPGYGDPGIGELAQPGAITHALDSVRALFPLSVWDVGFLLDAGSEITPAARAHREAIIAADAVLLVLGSRDTHLGAGFAQLDLLLDELAIPAERLRVVINGIGGPGAAPQRALAEALVPKLAERGVTADAWLAWDHRALKHASRTGTSLAAARPRGQYARALTQLLGELFLPDSTKPRARKLRLALPAAKPTAQARSEDREEMALPWQK